jgi:hypothetical protein
MTVAARVPQWLRQALVYAGVWHLALGLTIVLAPDAFFDLSRIPRPNYTQVWQGAGVMTAMMGVGYVITARNPLRYWPVILIGFVPKVVAPLGFAWGVWRDGLPLAFGSLVIIHDLLWWIPFAMLLWLAAREKAAGEYPRSTFRGTVREAMGNAITDSGESLLELSERAPQLVVFLRHGGCIFCRETLGDLQRLRAAIEATGVRLVLVHMGMPDESTTLVERYHLRGVTAISDPLRELYQAFDLHQGSFVQLFGPRAIASGMMATLKGHVMGWLEGDALQLPGAFVVSQGRILRAYRHAHAGDHVDFVALARGECNLPTADGRGHSAA